MWAMAMDWAEAVAMDFFNRSHLSRSHEYSTREPFRVHEASHQACQAAAGAKLGVGVVLAAAGLQPQAGCFVSSYHNVVFMGHIVEQGSSDVPSGGWVRVTLHAQPAIVERLAYVMGIFSIGHRFFIALDIYPQSALSEDQETGELCSGHAGVISNPRGAGGPDVVGRVLEVTEKVLHVWVLTRLLSEPGVMCRFVPKAGA